MFSWLTSVGSVDLILSQRHCWRNHPVDLKLSYFISFNCMPNSPDENWTDWISALIKNLPPESPEQVEDSSPVGQAKKLLAAIDQGGIPTDPIRINNIGRALGLDVLPSAPMVDTIERIRAEVNRP
jgi:hypothetical protein